MFGPTNREESYLTLFISLHCSGHNHRAHLLRKITFETDFKDPDIDICDIVSTSSLGGKALNLGGKDDFIVQSRTSVHSCIHVCSQLSTSVPEKLEVFIP